MIRVDMVNDHDTAEMASGPNVVFFVSTLHHPMVGQGKRPEVLIYSRLLFQAFMQAGR